MAHKKTARSGGTNQSGNDINNIDLIIAQHDELCTASALCAHALLHLAADTHDANLVRLAMHLMRIAIELHAIAQVLPAALMLATLESEVAA
jgi:hypothetical protein